MKRSFTALIVLLASCGARTDVETSRTSASCDACDVPTTSRIALGTSHGCVLVKGSVSCWGLNLNGELGDGTLTAHALPARVPNLDAVIGITASHGFDVGGPGRGSHTCAWKMDGSVVCWGANIDGNTDQVPRPTPTASVIAGWRAVLQVATGMWHMCARMSGGTVSCRGNINNMPTQPMIEPRVVTSFATSIAAGGDYSCAAFGDGSAKCWGLDVVGVLGNGMPPHTAMMPPLMFVDAPTPVVGLSDVVQVTAHVSHTCARKMDGSVWCWGFNNVGQLGDGTTTTSSRPVRVVGVDDAVSVSVGSSHTCALRKTGRVVCWGVLGGATPKEVMLRSDATEVASGYNSSCAWLRDDTVWCWGSLLGTNLGDGKSMGPGPVRVALP